MRANSFWFCTILSLNACSRGDISVSIFCISSSFIVEVKMPKMLLARSSGRPPRSIAAMVLSKSGGRGSAAILSMSARPSVMPLSSAVRRSAVLNLPNGGTPPHGPSHESSSGLAATGCRSFTNLSAKRSWSCVLFTPESAFQSRGSFGFFRKSASPTSLKPARVTSSRTSCSSMRCSRPTSAAPVPGCALLSMMA